MKNLRAEVIAIGDEMTSGQRLDTNTKWISSRLCDLGVEVAFHSTVGDTLEDNQQVFQIAGQRADIVVMTGGLGPTADDLTREALAKVANVELEFHQPTLDHIKGLYQKFKREMPERNVVQAYFPKGSNVIPNSQGTAPGIDLVWQVSDQHESRFFCMPGVPAEMFTMWEDSVAPSISKMTGSDSIIHHHVMHSFGLGESGVEETLGELTQRGRDPRVGITASKATISLRISTAGKDESHCLAKMQGTIETIEERLGKLIYGVNGQSLPHVVLQMLSESERTISIVDLGLGGAVAWAFHEAVHLDDDPDDSMKVVKGSCVQLVGDEPLSSIAQRELNSAGCDIAVVIGALEKMDGVVSFPVTLKSKTFEASETFNYAGHTDFRHLRSVKQVVNFLRLTLLEQN